MDVATRGNRQDERPMRLPIRFPLPPPGFDVLDARPEQLSHYGIPHRPDGAWQPALLRAWLRLFEGKPTFVPPKLLSADAFRIVPPGSPPAMEAGGRILRSENWSGAMVVPNGGRQVVLVCGEWVVPRPALPPANEQRGPPGGRTFYKCSTWIGLDGARRYRNSSLPQTGTIQGLTVEADGTSSVDCSAFFQWWDAEQTGIHLESIFGIDVKPGDRVMALLWAIDPHNVVVLFRNFRPPGQITAFSRPAPPIRLPDGSETVPSISGATAEWIMERPRPLILGSGALDLFPDYGSTEFSSCVAGTARQPGSPTAEQVLAAPRLLRMFERLNDAPARTQLISTPARVDATSFRVRYGGL